MFYVFAVDDLFYYSNDLDPVGYPMGPFSTYEEAYSAMCEDEECDD